MTQARRASDPLSHSGESAAPTTAAAAVPCNDSVLFKLAIENMAQGLFMLDGDQRIIVINRQVLDIYGLPGEIIKVGASAYELIAQSVRVGNFPGLTVAQAWAAASSRLAAKAPWRLQQRLGNGRVVAIAYAPIPGGGWVTTHLDVTDRQRAEDRLAFLAHHDALTGLANRALVLETLTAQLAAGIPFAVLCLDLDRFKAVNDNLGHAWGDELLRQVSRRLIAAAPSGALVARLGGDEFLVQFATPSTPGLARGVADSIVWSIAQPFVLGDRTVTIGSSIGIAHAPRDGGTPETLMHHADLALYRAKIEGRGARCEVRV